MCSHSQFLGVNCLWRASLVFIYLQILFIFVCSLSSPQSYPYKYNIIHLLELAYQPSSFVHHKCLGKQYFHCSVILNSCMNCTLYFVPGICELVVNSLLVRYTFVDRLESVTRNYNCQKADESGCPIDSQLLLYAFIFHSVYVLNGNLELVPLACVVAIECSGTWATSGRLSKTGQGFQSSIKCLSWTGYILHCIQL